MNRKGFTLLEATISMYLLSILIAIGISLVQFTTKTNFSEMKISSTRANISENVLYIQRDFQSSDKIFISDKEYRDEDGNLTNESNAKTETQRLFIKKEDISPEQFVSYRVEKDLQTKNTTLYFDGEKNKYWTDGIGNEIVSQIDTADNNLYKYVCPTNSNRVKDEQGRNIGSFLASLVFYENWEEELNTIKRYDSKSSDVGYDTNKIDYDFEKFTDSELLYYGLINGASVDSNMGREEILQELKGSKLYETFKQVKLNFVIEKYEGAKEGSRIELVLSNRLNKPILKCNVIDEP